MKRCCSELVSVIIPTYKRSDTLKRAIDSVCKQTYTNIEIIVVDDNALFPEIRENNRVLLSNYSNAILVENEVNLGGGLSRNAGIERSNGDFIAFLDDDDEYCPTKIEKQYKLFKELNNPNVAMIYCYANMVRVNGSFYTYAKDYEGNQLLTNVKNCIAPTSFWFCPKEKLLSVNGFDNISSRQDASLLLKFFLSGYEVYRVPEILLNYYWHDSAHGISKNNLQTAAAERQYRELYISNSRNVNPEVHHQILYSFSYRLAQIHILNGDRVEAHKELKIMKKYHSFSREILRVFFGIYLNKTYRYVSFLKNYNKVGK